MVEVHHYLFVGDVNHNALHTVAVLSHHRDNAVDLHIFFVELAVGACEDALFERHNHFGVDFAECFGWFESEIELIALFKALDAISKAFDHALLNAVDKAVGGFGFEFVHEFFVVIGVDSGNLVGEFHVLAEFYFFHIVLKYYSFDSD